jgi:hypothetical protein
MQLSQRTLLHRPETDSEKKGYQAMSDSKKAPKKAAAPVTGEAGTNAPVDKKDRKIRPAGLLAIIGTNPETGLKQTIDEDITEAGLDVAVEALPYGNYILRRYYDRPLVKAEIKRSSIKIG